MTNVSTRMALLLMAMLMISSCSMFKKKDLPEGPPAIWVNPASVAPMARGSHQYPYINLAVALENAGHGTRVLLAPGEYSGPLVIGENQKIELRPYFDIYSHERKGYRMEEGDVVLSAGDSSQPVLTVSGEINIQNIIIKGGTHALVVNEKAIVKVVDSDLVGASQASVLGINDPTAKGKPGELRLQSCNLLDNAAGVEIDGNYAEILSCKILNVPGKAVQATGDYVLTMMRNEIEGNAGAVDLTLDRKVKISLNGNTIRNNGGNGINLERYSSKKTKKGSVTISENRLVGNSGYGLAFADKAVKPLDAKRLEETIELRNNYYDSNAAGHFTGIEEF